MKKLVQLRDHYLVVWQRLHIVAKYFSKYDVKGHHILVNLHCNPVQGQYRARIGFSLCSISTQGKTCFQYRVPR